MCYIRDYARGKHARRGLTRIAAGITAHVQTYIKHHYAAKQQRLVQDIAEMRLSVRAIVLYIILTTIVVESQSNSTVLPIPSDELMCSYLEQPLCRNTGYDQTAFPNERDHETQDEAAEEMFDFSPLWTGEKPCSNAIVHLLCAYYFPFCGVLGNSGKNTTIKPCRNLCEEAREGCEEFIEEYANIGWPSFLECNYFPEQENEICFGPSDPSTLQLPEGSLTVTDPTENTDNTTISHTQHTCTSSLILIISFLLIIFSLDVSM